MDLNNENVDVLDVAIIGAGISGLAAARILTKAGITNFKVYEASDRVGGRTLVDEDGTDLGGAYFGPTQDGIISIIDELGLKLRKVNLAGKSVQHVGGQVQHYEGTIPPVSILGALDLNHAMVKMDAMCATINIPEPHLSKDAMRLDSMTGEQLIEQFAWTSDGRSVLRVGIKSILCVEPCQLSALYLLWYVAQSGGPKRIFETEGGAQDSKVVGGAGQIAPMLAARYAPGAKLCLRTPIRSIDSSGAVIKLHSDGLCVHAKYVIMAIPPVQMLRVHFTEPISPIRQQSLQRWPMGCICKTFMYYEQSFWTEKGLNGTLLSDDGIVSVSYCDTKEDGSLPSIMGFVLSHESLRAMTLGERKQAICEHYARCFESSAALHPSGYKEKMWAEEPWVGGCYVGTVGPGVLTSCRRAHAQPIGADRDDGQGCIFMAGTESALRMIGYMDGAVEAGERAARNVLVRLGCLGSEQYECMQTPEPSPQMPFVNMGVTAAEKLLPSACTLVRVGGAVLVAVIALAAANNLWLPRHCAK
jgi:monoamine oxidase